jgi:hypothetical protein
MKIGSEILWQGRRYVLAGVDPMNVPERRAYLRDPETGATVEAPFAEILALDDGAENR